MAIQERKKGWRRKANPGAQISSRLTYGALNDCETISQDIFQNSAKNFW